MGSLRRNVRRHKVFTLPKSGNRLNENEDACTIRFPLRIGDADRGPVRIAVSDGASQSAFARRWAGLLANAFAFADPPKLCTLNEGSFNEWLAPARKRWDTAVPWSRLPWHGKAKSRAGAFATLLGLTIESSPDGPPGLRWRAVAVGDSCLFVVREGRLHRSFPLEDPSEFGNRPDLVCSKPASAGRTWNAVHRAHDWCEPGDLFILATDALACWFLASDDSRERPWEAVAALNSSTWAGWVEDRRRSGQMRNDDTTLVMLEMV